MKNDVKMQDIADALGISKVTVSNALAGRSGVSQELRHKIEKTAIAMGYTYKRTENKVCYSIGVFVSSRYVAKGESFYWEMYWELASFLKSRGSATVFEMIKPEDEEHLILPVSLTSEKCDAVILIGKLDRQYLMLIKEKFKIPIVLLDYYVDDFQMDSVISDGYFGMYKMTEYLIQKGHSKIAFVGSIYGSPSIMDRFYGYCRALSGHKISYRQEWILNDRDIDTGDIIIEDFPDEMPTAFVCNCDLSANEVIKKLIEKGYKIPDDISIVGFDNYAKNNYYNIGVTSYDVNIRLMAEKAGNRIFEKIEKTTDEKSLVQAVPGKIIEKESVRDLGI